METAVDLSRKDHLLILKVDVKTGQVLWRAFNCGHVTALQGKFLYATERAEETPVATLNPGISRPPQFLLYRINPQSGKILWEYAKTGEVVDMAVSGNTI